MRILVVSQYFPPENAYYANSVVEGLLERGHSVKVLTGYPNYPNGRIFPGFKMRFRDKSQLENGVQLLRVPLYVDHSTNGLKRILNYLSFGFSSASAYRWAQDVDVIYVYAPQPTAAIGPWIWRRFGGRPYVIHIQDLWPDSVLGSAMMGKSRITQTIEYILSAWLRRLYNRSSAVIAIAPTMVATLRKRGVPKSLLHLLYNWSDPTHEEKSNHSSLDTSLSTFVFAGNIGEMQDVEKIIDAAEFLKSTPIQIKIIGDGVKLSEVQEKSRSLNQKNVEFLGRVPRGEMASLYATANYSLVTLKDLPVFRGTIPSKFQASLANGIPVITNVQGDLRDLVEEYGVGFTAESESAKSLAEVILKASMLSAEQYADQVKRTRQAFASSFSTDSRISELERILTEIVDSPN